MNKIIRGRIIFMEWIKREDLADRSKLFVFGDNMKQRGLGGQAASMRGESNAVGIPTKWAPSNAPFAFFNNDDFEKVKPTIDLRFERLFNHIGSGGDVVWPKSGIGTGLADIINKAPKIAEYIERKRIELEMYANGN